MDFLILGPLEVRDRGRVIALGGPQQRAVLAMLLLRANEAVSRDLLIEGIWAERPPKSAGHIIESYVSRLRRTLAANGGTAEILTQPHGYALRFDAARLDFRRFEHLVSEGRAQLVAGEAAGAAHSLESALTLFRGPPLDDLASFPFADSEVRRVEELRLAALEDRIEALLVSGRDGDLIAELSVLAEEHPFMEGFHGQLMRALYGAGRQAEALAVYRDLRRRLVDGLGIEPSPSLRRLELTMLRQEPVEPASVSRVLVPAEASAPATPDRPPAVRRRTLRKRLWTGLAAVAVAAGVAAVTVAVLRGGDDVGSPVSGGDSIAFIDPGDAAIRGGVALRAPPGEVVYGAGAVWVSQFEAQSVVRLDPRTMRQRQTIPVGSGASGMTFGNGSLWVANSLDGTVARIDPDTDRVVDTVAVGEGPAALAFGGGAVWVANANAHEVARLDGVTGEVTTRIPLPARPTGIAYARGALWITSQPVGSVFRVAPVSGDISQIHVGTGPTDIAAGARAVWVANTLDGTVSRISRETGVVTATLSVGNGPRDLDVGARGVWVANEFDGTIARIDPGGDRLVQSFEVGGRPQSVRAGAGACGCRSERRLAGIVAGRSGWVRQCRRLTRSTRRSAIYLHRRSCSA
jgi:YVTN family beta-propeller protein